MKRCSKKILIALIALIIVALVYFFPNGSDEEVYKQTIEYSNASKCPIYLKDSNNYIARTTIIMKEEDLDKRIKETIESLIINGSRKEYVPNGFNAIIPEDTKILSLDLDDGLLKINFSNNFLNVKLNDEEMMIESIVFSLTEIPEVKKVMIYVDGKLLTKLPNSKKKLPHYLTREYGINKIYDLTTINNSSMTTIYYLSKYNDRYYYVPVSLINNDTKNKVEIVINSLKSAPLIQNNLISNLVNSVELLSYELNEETASLNFNSYIFNNLDEKSISEEVKYTIFLSLKDNLGVNEVIFNVNDEKIDELYIEK
ncbi:MAG: GerMN domain-containing protein [Bacilli bacterium]